MKPILLALIIVSLGAIVSLAGGWDRSTKPKFPIAQAVGIAHDKLGTETNRFFCISASLHTNTQGDGFWSFDFASESGEQRIVSVNFDGKASVFVAPKYGPNR
ncbi:MAG: hypothetical protein EXS18_04645 [Verrucomicrobiae bacterium]|nr:hypothetical protein [Verrucomicrobiae bacterium]